MARLRHLTQLFPQTAAAACLTVLLLCAPANARTLTGEVNWSGEVTVEEDLRIAPGAVLRIAPGTRVAVIPAPSTKTDPLFWSPETEIAVEGTLLAEGTLEAPVRFFAESGVWGGVVAAPGGTVRFNHVSIEKAEEGILAAGGKVSARAVRFVGCDTGVVLGPSAVWKGGEEGVAIERPRVGVVDLRERIGALAGVSVTDAADAERLTLPWRGGSPPVRPSPSSSAAREFVGEYTVQGEETWKGVIVVSGRVTVPPGSLLTLSAGTRVLFRKTDSDGDGLGEGELLVTGSIRSLGTADKPVLFASAEADPRPGDWDKVSVISSEDADNRFVHTVFRHGVQALHAHFSALTVERCRFEENVRGLQFQESERTLVSDCVFERNKQAMRFRDSEVRVSGCRLSGNLYALHSFRCTLVFNENRVEDTALGGLLVKESKLTLGRNQFLRNRSALRARGEGSRAEMSGNLFEDCAETFLSLSGMDGRIVDNSFDGAGLDLLGIEDSRLTLRGNRFGRAGRHAIHLKGTADVDARENFWQGDPAERIHDAADDPALGKVLWKPAKGGEIQNLP